MAPRPDTSWERTAVSSSTSPPLFCANLTHGDAISEEGTQPLLLSRMLLHFTSPIVSHKCRLLTKVALSSDSMTSTYPRPGTETAPQSKGSNSIWSLTDSQVGISTWMRLATENDGFPFNTAFKVKSTLLFFYFWPTGKSSSGSAPYGLNYIGYEKVDLDQDCNNTRDTVWIMFRLPYRNLNYKAWKFTMVLSSLDIHGLNVSRMTKYFFGASTSGCIAQW